MHNPRIIRKLLDQVYPTDSSLDAFCIDHFPYVHKLFSSGMDRTAKVNMLLVHVSHLELHNHLVADLQSTTNDNNDPTTYPVIHRRIHWGKSIGVSIVVLMFMIAVIWHTFLSLIHI